MTTTTVCIVSDLSQFWPELEYLCNLFGSILTASFKVLPKASTIDKNTPLIDYCLSSSSVKDNKNIKIHIQPDAKFWADYKSKIISNLEWRSLDGLPLIKSIQSSNDFKKKSGNIIESELDVLASVFFLVTRMEEVWGNAQKDRHGRCLFENSYQNQDTISRPLINEYVDRIKNWLNSAYNLNISTRQYRLAALISHDIDIPYFYGSIRAEVSELYNYFKGKGKYHSVSDIVRFIKDFGGLLNDPYETFDYIRNEEQKRDITSTWFILMSSDNKWGLKIKKYSRRLRWLVSDGCEIGIHPGYHSAFDLEKIRQEKEEIDKMVDIQIKGVRNHFLRFAFPDSLRNYEKLGLLYDSTLGYAEQEGFRAGIATPFKPFDINTRTLINIIEIPLIVMDGVLKDYRGMDPREALTKIEQLIDVVATIKGTISFNWHNTFLAGNNNPWRYVFEKCLDYLVENRSFICNSNELAEIWSEYWN